MAYVGIDDYRFVDRDSLIGRKFIFPNQLFTEDMNSIENNHGKSIVIVITYTGCSCEIKELVNCRKLYDELVSQKINADWLVIISVIEKDKTKEAIQTYNSMKIDFPVIFDTTLEFMKNNIQPFNSSFNLYVLDDSVIRYVGNPLIRKKEKDKFLKEL
ncbi:MAG: hypothetical protein HUJ92_00360 [Bacteroidales bacterium]|nr:hypothetical protein [Bacteroidales bacterium]